MRPSKCQPKAIGLRRTLVAALFAAAVLVGCSTRPDFDRDRAHGEIATAFGRKPAAVQMLDDGPPVRKRPGGDGESGSDDATTPAAESDTWIVDFRLDGFDPYLQAKFVTRDHDWHLDVVRERPSGPTETPWTEIGAMLGRFKAETVERSLQTEKVIRDAATYIERYSVEHGNRFPSTNLDGVRKLVIGSGYVEEGRWRHDSDAWGNSLAYHAAPDGAAYILISPGADGRWDVPLDTYFSNTDQGMEIYGGTTTDPNLDVIWASGSFVQSSGQ